MTIKQEQHEARDTVEQVAEGVLRMQLPIAIPGLRHVNMYCFPDDRGATVIDPGLPDEANWVVVKDRLKQAGFEVRHVHTVLVTHSHPDHFGGAARFHAEAGARVIAHEEFSVFGERPHLAEPEVSVEHMSEPRAVAVQTEGERKNAETLATASFRSPWGGDAPDQADPDRKQWERMRASSRLLAPPITHVLRHGDTFRLGGRPFTVVHSPGHTADHICLFDREAGTLVAGDHVLPSITPHISGLNSIVDPLRAYYDSLDRIVELGRVTRCLPAHGDPFDDVVARVEAIKRHHDGRLDKLHELTRRMGPASVRDLSHGLFSERSWGIMAESETYAHLEHLRLAKRVEAQRRADGLLLYTG
jgi:glyoxylase-like metal-dependent hydrolase (beta-lactamase superfamily II)